MSKPLTIVGTLLCVAIISLTTNANQSALFPDQKGSTPLPRVANFPGDISDKLAADSRFIELIN
jgi:hypothetical protein